MEFVALFDAGNLKDLKKVLEAEPYADDSFAKLGYTLKESKAIGLEEGKYVVYFKTEDEALGKKLEERLGEVPSFKQATDEEKEKVVQAINAEQDDATQGFGSIFGE